MANDVLEVLRAYYSQHGGSEDAIEATAKIAELIAADVEYDEAKDEFRRLDAQVRLHGTDEWRNASIRLMHASSRRQAALAACRGLA